MSRPPGTSALVTGGNRGLGLEVVRLLAQQGHRVILTGRSGREAAEHLRAEGRRRGLEAEVVYEPLDVTDPGSVRALAERLATGAEGDLGWLICNAGIWTAKDDRASVPSQAREVLDVNLDGALRVVDALVPRLRSGGRVVLVSSSLGELTGVAEDLRQRFLHPTLDRPALERLRHDYLAAVQAGRASRDGWPRTPYNASKALLNAAARVLARELSPQGIAVLAVCPGWCRTDMGGAQAPRSAEAGARSIVWAATAPEARTGTFTRDGRPVPW